MVSQGRSRGPRASVLRGVRTKAKDKGGDTRNSLDRKEQAGALALGKQNKQRRQQQQKQKPGAVAVAAAAVAVEQVEGVARVVTTKSPTSTSRDKGEVLGMKMKEGKKRKHPQMSRGEPTLMPDPDTVSAVPVETKTALRRSPRKKLELEDNEQKQMRGKAEKQSEYDLIIQV